MAEERRGRQGKAGAERGNGACAYARMRACMRACMHACVRACVRVCVRACVHTARRPSASPCRAAALAPSVPPSLSAAALPPAQAELLVLLPHVFRLLAPEMPAHAQTAAQMIVAQLSARAQLSRESAVALADRLCA